MDYDSTPSKEFLIKPYGAILRRIGSSVGKLGAKRGTFTLLVIIGLIMASMGAIERSPLPTITPVISTHLVNDNRPAPNTTVYYDPGMPDITQAGALQIAIHEWENQNPHIEFIESDNATNRIIWENGTSAACQGDCEIRVGDRGCGHYEGFITNEVMHGLGHMIGLGHSHEKMSAMYGPPEEGLVSPTLKIPRKFSLINDYESMINSKYLSLTMVMSVYNVIDTDNGTYRVATTEEFQEMRDGLVEDYAVIAAAAERIRSGC